MRTPTRVDAGLQTLISGGFAGLAVTLVQRRQALDSNLSHESYPQAAPMRLLHRRPLQARDGAATPAAGPAWRPFATVSIGIFWKLSEFP